MYDCTNDSLERNYKRKRFPIYVNPQSSFRTAVSLFK